MTDQNNEKVQFLLAALRSAKWTYDLATWGGGTLSVLFYRPGQTQAIQLDLNDTPWDELTPTQKLTAATNRVVVAENGLRESGFDPTQPKPAA